MGVKTAILLTGGRGNRLRNLESSSELSIPKPMISVLGRPLLEYNVEYLKRHGVERIVFGVAYKKERVKEYFGDGRKFGVDIEYSEHSVDDGTGDAFRKAIENAGIQDEYLFAMNGDQLTTFPLKKLGDYQVGSPYTATILLVHPICPYGVVECEGRDVVSFKEKPKLESLTVNAGIYSFGRGIKGLLGGDIEKNTFVKLSKERRLSHMIYDGFWDTVNTWKDLERLEEILKNDKRLREYFGID